MTSPIWHEKSGDQKLYGTLCWKSIAQISTLEVTLITSMKLIRHWSESQLVCFSETNICNQNQLVKIRPFNWKVSARD